MRRICFGQKKLLLVMSRICLTQKRMFLISVRHTFRQNRLMASYLLLYLLQFLQKLFVGYCFCQSIKGGLHLASKTTILRREVMYVTFFGKHIMCIITRRSNLRLLLCMLF
ncbi:hypothetical protein M8C21_002812, partial [Ambrosia artemisiifolia]